MELVFIINLFINSHNVPIKRSNKNENDHILLKLPFLGAKNS